MSQATLPSPATFCPAFSTPTFLQTSFQLFVHFNPFFFSHVSCLLPPLPELQQCTSEHAMADTNNMNRIPALDGSAEMGRIPRVRFCGVSKTSSRVNVHSPWCEVPSGPRNPLAKSRCVHRMLATKGRHPSDTSPGKQA